MSGGCKVGINKHTVPYRVVIRAAQISRFRKIRTATQLDFDEQIFSLSQSVAVRDQSRRVASRRAYQYLSLNLPIYSIRENSNVFLLLHLSHRVASSTSTTRLYFLIR